MVGLLRMLGLLALLAGGAAAQSRDVDPDDLLLDVTLEETATTPLAQEMVLLTIHGIYKRHVTREQLIQPEFANTNWMQLGEDHWYESMLDGKPVKNMRRRIALFPDRAGRVEIGAFTHRLTLLDEDNKWFEHDITSAPLTFEVAARPAFDGWWFPIRGLEVTDNWSNPPDQLKPGEGVLRVVRVAALGAGPDMLPPMPELRSPSGLVFAHPEKRLVNLTPRGPEAIAFWRWTITPTNGRSAILEPIRFDYFDTRDRQMHEVVITPQRVAFGEVVPPTAPMRDGPTPYRPLAPWVLALLVLGAAAVAVAAAGVAGLDGLKGLARRIARWQMRYRLGRAARTGDSVAFRRLARALDRQSEPDSRRAAILRALDSQIFGPKRQTVDLGAVLRDYRATLS